MSHLNKGFGLVSLLLLVIICTDFIIVPIPCLFLKTIFTSDICGSLFIGHCQHCNVIFIFMPPKSLLCLLPQFLSHYLYVSIHFNSVMLSAQSFVVPQHFRMQDLAIGFLFVIFNVLHKIMSVLSLIHHCHRVTTQLQLINIIIIIIH